MDLQNALNTSAHNKLEIIKENLKSTSIHAVTDMYFGSRLFPFES